MERGIVNFQALVETGIARNPVERSACPNPDRENIGGDISLM
jgi:hypothetical protein